jgi:hypothetical protein
MTRREKALRGDIDAMKAEYDDLLAFYDAAVEEGLSEAHEAHKVYCANQGTRGPQNG